MANIQNLKSWKPGDRTSEQAVEAGRKGGLASAAARQERKLIKDRILERMGESDWDTMIDNLIKRAAETDKAFEVLRDTIGEKPVEHVETDSRVEVVMGGDAADLSK